MPTCLWHCQRKLLQLLGCYDKLALSDRFSSQSKLQLPYSQSHSEAQAKELVHVDSQSPERSPMKNLKRPQSSCQDSKEQGEWWSPYLQSVSKIPKLCRASPNGHRWCRSHGSSKIQCSPHPVASEMRATANIQWWSETPASQGLSAFGFYLCPLEVFPFAYFQ